MYELDEKLKPYYMELDPAKRLAILDAMPEDDTVKFLRTVYNNRYSDHENRGRKNVDWWLWRCICLQQLCNKGGFFKKFREREINTIIVELLMNDSHESLMYHEYRNVAGRYLSTCRSGNYASRFMGFRQASDDEKVLKACEDIWQMSGGIAQVSGFGEKMRLWCTAFHDELAEYDAIGHEEYIRLDNQRRK